MARTRWLRIACFAAGFIAACASVPWAVYRAMERAAVEEPYTNLGPVEYMRKNLEQFRSRLPGRPDAPRVALFGDSVMVSYPPGRMVDDALQLALRRLEKHRRPIRVIRLALPGMGPFDYYFLADTIAAAHPDSIVYPFNLAAFGDGWRRRFVRPELSGWLPARRVPESFLLPLHWIGLTSDRFLLYLGLSRTVPFDTWYFIHRQQARVGAARTDLIQWAGERFGRGAESDFETARYRYNLRRDEIPKRQRFSPLGLRTHYGPALDGVGPDHPAIQMLAVTLRIFQEAGIPTLVFVTPLNVEFMASVTSLDPEGLARTIQSIGDTARDEGAVFLDLHRLLPDEGFRDAAGHLAYEGDLDGPGRLAAALAPSVLKMLKIPAPGR